MVSTPTERIDHPTDDALERYALQRLIDPELSAVEEHIFCCPHCQARLDETDSWVSLMRTALGGETGQEAAVRKPMAFAVDYGSRVRSSALSRVSAVSPARNESGASGQVSRAPWQQTGLGSSLSDIGKLFSMKSGLLAGSMPRMALAGAALAALVLFLPFGSELHRNTNPVNVNLRAERGDRGETAPAGQPLRLNISAEQTEDAARGAVAGMDGSIAAQGDLQSPADKSGMYLDVPSGLKAGRYWFRILAADGTLVRESQLVVR